MWLLVGVLFYTENVSWSCSEELLDVAAPTAVSLLHYDVSQKKEILGHDLCQIILISTVFTILCVRQVTCLAISTDLQSTDTKWRTIPQLYHRRTYRGNLMSSQ